MQRSRNCKLLAYHKTGNCDTGAAHHHRVLLHVDPRAVDATLHVSIRGIHRVRAGVAVESLRADGTGRVRSARKRGSESVRGDDGGTRGTRELRTWPIK